MEKGLAQAPNIPSFQPGGSLLPPTATQVWVSLICFYHPSITKSTPIPLCDWCCPVLPPPVKKAAVLTLPQLSPRAMEKARARTLPIILLMMQSQFQPFLPRGAACQPSSSTATEGMGLWVDPCPQLS